MGTWWLDLVIISVVLGCVQAKHCYDCQQMYHGQNWKEHHMFMFSMIWSCACCEVVSSVPYKVCWDMLALLLSSWYYTIMECYTPIYFEQNFILVFNVRFIKLRITNHHLSTTLYQKHNLDFMKVSVPHSNRKRMVPSLRTYTSKTKEIWYTPFVSIKVFTLLF